MPKETFSQPNLGPEKPEEISKKEAFRRYRELERHLEARRAAEKREEIRRAEDFYQKAMKRRAEIFGQTPPSPKEERVELKEVKEEMARLLQILGGEEGLRKMKVRGLGELRAFLKNKRLLERDLREAEEEISLLRQSDVLQEPVGQEKLADLEELASLLREDIEIKLPSLKPEWFVAHWLLRLREYKEQLEKTGIVETSYVKQMGETIREKLTRDRIVALMGETGTGKTVMARKIASQLGQGRFEFVVGHPFMTSEDLLSFLGLKPEDFDPLDQLEKIRQAKARLREVYPDLSSKDLKHWEEIIEKIIAQKQPALKTEVIFGPAFRAAQEGIPLIIDEFNYLPPQALGMLNALLDAKPGSSFTVGEKEIKIKKGFCVIFTGNLTKQDFERYLGRQDLDPAFLNRVNSGYLEYHMPPQDIDRAFSLSIISQEKLKEGERVPARELFQIGLAHIVDRKGNLVAPHAALEEVWRLSQAIALIQRIYAGERIRAEGELGKSEFFLQKYPVSLRTFGRGILEKWRDDGFRYQLEWYIWDALIRPAFAFQPEEAAQMFYIFKERYRFFQGKEWEEIKVDPNNWKATESVELFKGRKREDFPVEVQKKFYQPKELAQALAGLESPLRKEREEDITQEIMEIERLIEEKKEKFKNIENLIERICRDEERMTGSTPSS